MDWRNYITIDLHVCDGKPCIKGTRILVSTILDNLAAGMSSDTILQSYPSLSHEAIDAVMLYEAGLARDDVDLLPTSYVSYMAGLYREIWEGVDTDEYLAGERDERTL